MKRIANLPSNDRMALFRNTAGKLGMNEAIIEKDFWVCWMLDYLFHRCRWKGQLAFKGGTSLSKAYGLIQRFSEDIDLILDWRVLGYEENEPWEDRSNTKQDLFNKQANIRAEIFLREEFLPAIISDVSTELKTPVKFSIDISDGQTVRFSYPRDFSQQAILQDIRLEIGALSAWTPTTLQLNMSYAAQEYSHLFEQASTEVLTVQPERTFWEKATILHRELFRARDSEIPSRYSRHYYDLFLMSQTLVKERALADIALLDRVAQFKEKFYRCPWARYDLAKHGTLRLSPPDYRLEKLDADYSHMRNMIFGAKPGFDGILSDIA